MSFFSQWGDLPLDRLPANWTTAKIGEIAEVQPGFASGRHNSQGIGIPHLRPMNITREGSIDLSNLKYVDSHPGLRLGEGDVLFNNTNSPELVGKTAAVSTEFELAFSNHMTRVRPRLGIEPTYLSMQLHYLWMTGYFRYRCTNHVNQASISSTTLAETVPLLLAPLAEQRRIVAEIEKQFTRLDAATNILNSGLKRCDLYRTSLLSQAISSDWHCEPLGSMSARITSGSRDWSQYYGRGAGTFIMAQNVRTSGLDLSFRQAVDPPESDSSCERSQVKGNDILVTIVGANTGETCIVERDLPEHYVCQSVALIRLKNPEAAPFVSIYLASPSGGQRQFDDFNYGAGRPHLSFEQLKATLVPFPPPDVQRRIVDDVQLNMSTVAQVKSTLTSNRFRAARLRQSILKQAFLGKLVPQDPDDEPAAILLERIRSERQPHKASKQRFKQTNHESGSA